MNASPPQELPLIQGLWIGDELPELAQVSIRSFIEKGHGYHLYAYRSFPDLPPGCVLKDANEILPEKYIYARELDDSLASFSDWFRYELLSRKGGYYVDTDIVCLKPFDLDEYFMAADQGAPPDRPRARGLNGAVLRTKKGNMICRVMCVLMRHPRLYVPLAMLYRTALKTLRWDWRGWRHELWLFYRDWGLLCSRSKRLREYWGVELSHYAYQGLVYVFAIWLKRYAVMPLHYFYPLSFKRRNDLLNDTYAHTDNPFPESYAVHLWQSELPDLGENNLHPNSLWRQLRRRYLPQAATEDE